MSTALIGRPVLVYSAATPTSYATTGVTPMRHTNHTGIGLHVRHTKGTNDTYVEIRVQVSTGGASDSRTQPITQPGASDTAWKPVGDVDTAGTGGPPVTYHSSTEYIVRIAVSGAAGSFTDRYVWVGPPKGPTVVGDWIRVQAIVDNAGGTAPSTEIYGYVV